MKIISNTVSPLDRIMKEIVWWTHALVSVPLIYLTAGLLPGDNINLNVIGSLVMIITFVVIDLVITVPCTAWRRKIRKPVLAPVRTRVKW